MKCVVVGCGVAGINAALAIRRNSSEAEISIYTDEDHLYYPRPRLYEIISGEMQPQDIYSFKPEFYEDKKIKVYLKNRVTSIDLTRKEILLADHSRTNWEKLLLANGAHPFMPPIKGVEKNGVFTLRTIVDAVFIKERLMKSSKAIVIGAGLLGLELAASVKKAGRDVDVIDTYPRLLPKQLDQDGSEVLREYLEKLGMNPLLNVSTKEILGKDEATGVSLENGRELDGGIVVIAAGVRPNVELAASTGIKTDKGVIVDEHLQTSATDVYAIGDAIEFTGQVYGIIPPALDQAKIAASNMLGDGEHVYTGTIHTTTLKIAGIKLTSMGLVDPEGTGYEEIKRTSKEEGVYKKIVLQNGRIVGAIFLGDKEGVTTARRLMEQGTDVTDKKERLLESTSRT